MFVRTTKHKRRNLQLAIGIGDGGDGLVHVEFLSGNSIFQRSLWRGRLVLMHRKLHRVELFSVLENTKPIFNFADYAILRRMSRQAPDQPGVAGPLQGL